MVSTLCSYKTNNAGGCKILLHPKWESAVYPASIFTTAPAEMVINIVQQDEFKPSKR